jgi:putative transposase
MILAHKIRLYPNDKQATLFEKSCGVARFAYNWALIEWKRQYEAGEKPNEAKLRKQLNAIKAEQFPWMRKVSKTAPQQAIENLGQAMYRFG